MSALRRFWDQLTGRDQLIERITALGHAVALAGQAEALAKAEQRATAAMLETSRLEHGIALQKVEASEMALLHLHERVKREKRKRRQADRTWIARRIAPRVTEN